MPIQHNVEEGDGLSRIAFEYGFFWETVWNHSGNAGLRQVRDHPEVLLPGDVVEIPDKRPKCEPTPTGKVTKFRLKSVPVRLQVRLVDEDGKPRKDLGWKLDVDGDQRSGVTGEDGFVRAWVKPSARNGLLSIGDGKEKYDIDFGYIDPLDTVTGAQSVLRNLGYYSGPVSGTADAATAEGLRAFQRRSGLPATGEPDAATAAALKAAYMAAGS